MFKLFIERKKALKNLVLRPGSRKNLSVIKLYTRIQLLLCPGQTIKVAL